MISRVESGAMSSSLSAGAAADENNSALEFSTTFAVDPGQKSLTGPVHAWDYGSRWRLLWFPRGNNDQGTASVFLELENAENFAMHNDQTNVVFQLTLMSTSADRDKDHQKQKQTHCFQRQVVCAFFSFFSHFSWKCAGIQRIGVFQISSRAILLKREIISQTMAQ